MKAPQRAGGRTDQMLGAMGDILTSLALPSQHWVPDLCSQEQGVEMQPQARGAAEASEEKKDQLHEPPPEEAMGSGTVEVQTATTTEEDPYSIAGSDGSISASVASIQPQASSSSAPSSPGSRHSVSTLKKWLTNPVRKLSAGGLPRGDRPLRKAEGRMRRHGRQEDRKSIDLGLLGQVEGPFAVPREPIGTDGNSHLPDLSLLSSLLEGDGAEKHTQVPDPSPLPSDCQSLEPPSETPLQPLASEEQEEEERRSALEKSMFVLRELIETEKMYVEDLGQIVEGYMATMKARGIPEGMKGKDKIIFGNIHQIYDWHKDYFLKQLEKCLEDPDLLAELFIKHERRLHMYVVYCQNKPKSEHIVSEFIDTYFEELKQELGHRLQLNDLLIKPVQRIMKYQLLLKVLNRDKGGVGAALSKVKLISPFRNGSNHIFLALKGGVSLAPFPDEGPHEAKCIFSFTGAFTPTCYSSLLQVSCLGLEPSVDSDPCKFALISRGAERGTIRYVLQAATPEIAQAWVADVNLILETQRDFLNALQSPIEYQRRESKTHSLGRTGSPLPSLPGGSARPHSSASLDQNKGPSLQTYDASLLSLYLPGAPEAEHPPYVRPADSQSSPGSARVHIPSDGAESLPPSDPQQELLHMAPSDDDARLLLPDPDFLDIRFPQGSARLAKLDEDEL
ncbi:rho guanine nucleotide exchange factor 25 [Sphaerodactylus townsendi]|uniref:rho guanine nucleotide exchange factor 25 n=1 Tax=Sphaerodactylus townsendi TaxID=933632 RepID=UPI002025DF3A|nr:rho guanine nucleotide exchange factor 25 [Sphaerodactylus townsendi]